MEVNIKISSAEDISAAESILNQLKIHFGLSNQETASVIQSSNNIGISEILTSLGMRRNLAGFEYIKYAIECGISDSKCLNNYFTELYPAVAGKFETLPNRAERAIRHSIENAWPSCREKFNQIFGTSFMQKKPTNSEFISTIAGYLRDKGGM